MVAEYSDHAVRMIVRVQLLLHRARFRCSLVELLLERYGRVMRTAHLRREAFHI